MLYVLYPHSCTEQCGVATAGAVDNGGGVEEDYDTDTTLIECNRQGTISPRIAGEGKQFYMYIEIVNSPCRTKRYLLATI